MKKEIFYDEDGISLNPDISNKMSKLEKSMSSRIVKNIIVPELTADKSDIESVVRELFDILDSQKQSLSDLELGYLITERLRYFFERELFVVQLSRKASPPLMDFECINKDSVNYKRYKFVIIVKDMSSNITYELEL